MEADIQSKIIKYLKSKGAFVVKTIVLTTSGVPDILCCYKGYFIAFEVKTATNEATPLQKATLKRIKNAKGLGAVVRSVDDVKECLLLWGLL